MKVVVVIQARMGSSRLPGKILMPLGEQTTLHYVTERCKQIKGVADVIVATSTLEKDNQVEQWCLENQIHCFRGSETNVLQRYMEAVQDIKPDYILRVTADCPFVDYELASELVEKLNNTSVDIIDLQGELPRGLAVEAISYRALQYIAEHAHAERHYEHVTYYAYEYKNEFKRAVYEVSKANQQPQLRITLDTKEDYEVLSKIASHFKNPLVSSSDVIGFLLKNPQIAQINRDIVQKPVV